MYNYAALKNKRSFTKNVFKFNFCIYLFIINFSFSHSDNNLNNIIVFNSTNFRAGNFAINKKGDMIIEYSSNNKRLFYGIKKNGKYFFKDMENKEVPTKIIEIINKENSSIIGRYESRNMFISLENDINSDNQYLFSTSSFSSVTELYNITNLDNKEYKIKTTSNIFEKQIFSFAFSLQELTNEKQKNYLLIYTYTTDDNNKGNMIEIVKFSFQDINLNIRIIKEVQINDNNCNRIVSSYIANQCIILFYLNTNSDFMIRIYDFSLSNLSEKKIGGSDLNNYNKGNGHFFKCIHLKGNTGVFIFYEGQTFLNPIIIIEDINNDYSFSNKFTKKITEYYFQNDLLLNDLIKINDNRFSFITSSFNKTILYILLFDLYNNDKDMKIRIYENNLLNIKLFKELSTIIYNNYLLFTSTINSLNSDSEDTCLSILMVFGYSNGTDSNIDISEYFMDDYINSSKNIITKLIENITIENNIFGYEVIKQIKLTSIPDEIIFYNIENGYNNKISNGGILNLEYIFKQNQNKVKTYDYYTLEYQFIIQETNYDKFNEFPIDIINCTSLNSTSFIDQKDYFNKTIFYGRTNTVKFKLCYDFCGSCYKYGTDINDQKCESCLDDYQYDYPLISLPNCVPEGYYKNSDNEIISHTIGNPKYFVNSTNNKTIYFKNTLFCPEEYPFLIIFSNECKSSCSYIELLSKNCSFSQENEIIYNELKNNVIKTYPVDGESLVIEANEEYVFQLTTSLNELNTLEGKYVNGYNLSLIDLGDCEKLLKDEYNIEQNTPLIILKFEKLSSSASEKNVQYEIYSPNNKTKIDLSKCQSSSIGLYIPISINEKTQSLYKDLAEYGYDLFNMNDSFYTDICTPYESENGTDVLLSDRKIDFFSANETMCQANCKYSNYYFEIKYLKCECIIGNEDIDTKEPEKFNGKLILTSFYEVLKYSNFKVFKCYKLVFNINSITKNIGSIIIIIYFIAILCCFVFYLIKGLEPLKIYVVRTIAEKQKRTRFHTDNDSPNKKDKEKLRNIKIYKNKKKKEKINVPPKRNISKNENKNEKHYNMALNKTIHKTTILLNNKRKNKLTNISDKKIKKKLSIKENSSKLESIIINNKNDSLMTSKRKMAGAKKNIKFNDLKIDEMNKVKNLSKDNLDDFELNELDYFEAIEIDKRPFSSVYWSTLKREHIILFTFFSWNDYNISYIKFARFFFLLSSDMAMNVFFFSDDSMHKIYLNYGKYDFIQQIPQIIYSTIVSRIFEVILCYLSLTDRHIYEIKALKNNKLNKIVIFQIINCIKYKLIGFFIFIFVFMAFFWYIVSAFCAVYENTQITYIKDSLSSFSTSLISPFIIYLFTVTLRIISLKDVIKKRLKFVYKLSGILPIF